MTAAASEAIDGKYGDEDDDEDEELLAGDSEESLTGEGDANCDACRSNAEIGDEFE